MPAAEHLDEDLAPRVVGADDLAVEDGVVDAEPRCQRRRERVEVLEAIAVARDEANARAIDFEQAISLIAPSTVAGGSTARGAV